MEIQMKTFLKKIAPFILFILTLEIAVPILVDPYNVFHWKRIRDNGVEPNSNYIKMQYILHNPDKFDSFLFGSSRTGFIDVEKFHMETGTICHIRRGFLKNIWRTWRN